MRLAIGDPPLPRATVGGPQGWECPRCHATYAPWMAACTHCAPIPKGLRDRLASAAAPVPRISGLHVWHWSEVRGSWCGGWLGFTNVEGHPPDSKHELVGEDPLTVTPSLLCSTCQHHGFIRDGKWIPA